MLQFDSCRIQTMVQLCAFLSEEKNVGGKIWVDLPNHAIPAPDLHGYLEVCVSMFHVTTMQLSYSRVLPFYCFDIYN